MNNLRDLLKELSKRTKEHRNYYERNETAVRTQLIDPILNALGWDTSNPDYVKHNETTTDKDIPDYALLKNKQRKLFVEAKNLKVDINNKKTVRQIADYCYHNSTDYGVLTNGMNWLLFETYQKDTDQRVVWSINFEKDNPEDALVKLDTLTFQNIDNLNELTKKLKTLDRVWTEIINDRDLLANVLSKVIQDKIKESNQNLAFSSNEIKDYIAVKLQVNDLKEKHLLPDLQQIIKPDKTIRIPDSKPKSGEYSQFPDYVQKRIKAIQNPSSMTHKMLNYIKDNQVATKREIRDFIINLYDNPGSGSIDGNLNTLRHLGLIKYDERGEYAKVYFIKLLD